MLLYDALLPYRDTVKSIRKKVRKAQPDTGKEYRRFLKKADKEITLAIGEMEDFERHIKIAPFFSDEDVLQSTKKWITDPNTWFEGERTDAVQALINPQTRFEVNHELNIRKLFVKEQLAQTGRLLSGVLTHIQESEAILGQGDSVDISELSELFELIKDDVKAANKTMKALSRRLHTDEGANLDDDGERDADDDDEPAAEQQTGGAVAETGEGEAAAEAKSAYEDVFTKGNIQE